MIELGYRSHQLDDEEYRQISDAYNRFFTKFAEAYADYVQFLEELCIEGLVSGEIAENFRTFTNIAKTPLGDLDTAGRIVYVATNTFLPDIDSADYRG